MKITSEQLIECYDCVFTNEHSDGFKEAEMKELITDKEYRFLERPKQDWEDNLRAKLKQLGFDLDELKKE